MGLIPSELTKYRYVKDPPVELVKLRYESHNNLWNPILDAAPMSPVLFVDDENFPELDKVELARETWGINPWALVGFFPRYHYKQLIMQQESNNPEIDPIPTIGETPITTTPCLVLIMLQL